MIVDGSKNIIRHDIPIIRDAGTRNVFGVHTKYRNNLKNSNKDIGKYPIKI